MIQLRTVLDDIQGRFTKHLTPSVERDLSLHWRNRLTAAAGDHDQDRINYAQTQMATSPYGNLLNSDAAMMVICQSKSSIRPTADQFAHTYAYNISQLAELQGELGKIISDPMERKGMSDIIDYLSQDCFSQ